MPTGSEMVCNTDGLFERIDRALNVERDYIILRAEHGAQDSKSWRRRHDPSFS